MTNLTDRQTEILDYIRGHMSRTGVTPSTRQIQAHFKLASQSSAQHHLNRLEKKGMIQRTGKRYALAGEIVMWADVKPLLKVIRFYSEDCYAMELFLAKYPHLTP